jgi:hypothetical protein
MLRRIAIVTALLVSACATGAQPQQQARALGARDCFLASQVRGFNPVDAHHIRISVGASDQYVLGTDWNAYDLQYAERIALHSTTGTICTGNGLGVDVVGGDNHQRYPINSIERAPQPAPAAPQGS